MRALVTGATGYIGTFLCRALIIQGWDVQALVRPTSDLSRLPSSVVTHSLDHLDLVRLCAEIKPDVVFHLAAQVTPDNNAELSPAILHGNLDLGVNLLEAIVAASPHCRFIHTGSYWEYDAAGNVAPNSLYAAAKCAFATVLDWYVRRYQLQSAKLVLFDVYGPDDPRGKLWGRLIESIRTSENLALAEGEQILDLVHVEDVVAAYLAAALSDLTAGTLAIYNVATGKRMSLRQIVALLGEVVGQAPQVNWGGRPYPAHQIMVPLAADYFPAPPHWQPRWTLEAGFRQLLEQSKKL